MFSLLEEGREVPRRKKKTKFKWAFSKGDTPLTTYLKETRWRGLEITHACAKTDSELENSGIYRLLQGGTFGEKKKEVPELETLCLQLGPVK